MNFGHEHPEHPETTDERSRTEETPGTGFQDPEAEPLASEKAAGADLSGVSPGTAGLRDGTAGEPVPRLREEGVEEPAEEGTGEPAEELAEEATEETAGGPAGAQGRPFAFGDLVVFVDSKQRRRLQRLRPGRVFQAPPGGAIRHDDVAGLPEGAVVHTTTGQPILCLRPTLEEYILAMPRRTQVIYPKDLGQILVRSNLGPGGRALEAGVGSGATSLALLRLLGPTGTLISYERRPEFAALARDNVRRFLGEDPPNWRIELRDVYEGIDERGLDAVVLDVPEPYRCVDAAAAAVRPGGVLLAWLPTTNQVQELVVALRRHPAWDLVDTTELLLRPWHVSQESVRPEHRMVAHTGFLITARRVTGPAARTGPGSRD